MGHLPQAPPGAGELCAGRRLGRRTPFGSTSLHDEAGQGLVEYSLIIMLVALIAIPALEIIGVSVTGFLADAAQKVGDI